MANKKNLDLKFNLLIFFGILLCSVILAVSLSIYYLYSLNEDKEPITFNCSVLANNYFVYFNNNQVKPTFVEAMPCDTITFVNQDKFRIITFGMHNQHVSYNGILELPMATGESFTITLDKSGDYHFHDHNQPEVNGSFKVADL